MWSMKFFRLTVFFLQIRPKFCIYLFKYNRLFLFSFFYLRFRWNDFVGEENLSHRIIVMNCNFLVLYFNIRIRFVYLYSYGSVCLKILIFNARHFCCIKFSLITNF
eukprot:NODE_351_length_8976_cov_1.105666.p8 type:complete len:106 gc:universal NODE_351_length_8976_cov_1.105666:5493-5810(+)